MTLSLDKALDRMRRGSQLVLMHSDCAYYVVPGRRVAHKDANKILARPDVFPFDGGPFPGHPQSWKMGAA